MAHPNPSEIFGANFIHEHVKIYVDGDNKFYRVSKHDAGIFLAEDIETGKQALVDALTLEACREATNEEIEKLGIK